MAVVIILIVVSVVLLVGFVGVAATTRTRRARDRAAPKITEDDWPPKPAAAGTAVLERPRVDEAPPAVVEVPTGPEARPALRDRLGRARGLFSGYLDGIRSRKGIDDATFDDLEEALLLADAGVATTTQVLDDLRARVRTGDVAASDPSGLLDALRSTSSTCSPATTRRSPSARATARRSGSSSG